MEVVERDPFQAARDLLGPHYEERNVSALGVNSHSVDDLGSVSHLPLQSVRPDPAQLYNYASSTTQQYQADMPQMGSFAMNQSDAFDVDNPWDMDRMLGNRENEGDRAAAPPSNNGQYNPQDEFHYTF
ncbi:hypothetical protein V8C37DRAFT_383787 [Trichoderma ceciliae]